uniref:Genome polyprotein n=1 Tax=Beihai picorna-like virus 38 TaxID=1922581 RepID=A0A1L3KNF9_9VIRU|nr:hypothetical protein 1 [Beihai picorna-like virus 38]
MRIKMYLKVSNEMMATIFDGANALGVNTHSPKEDVWTPDRIRITRSRSMQAQFGQILESITSIRKSVDTITSTMDAVNEVLDKCRQVMKLSGDDSVTEAIIARLESLLILILELNNAHNLQGCLYPMLQYIKTWCPNKSFVYRFQKYLVDILTKDSDDNEVDVPAPQGLEVQGGWFETNWVQLVNGAFGKRLASAINLLILTGFCPEKVSNSFTAEVYQILNLQALRRQNSSILLHIFRTIDWVVDSVVPAFVNKDMSLLLHDEDVSEVDSMYRNALDMVQKDATGQHEANKEKYGVADQAEIVVYLVKTAAAHLAIKQKCKDDTFLQKEFLRRLTVLDKLQNDIQAGWHAKGSRAQPFAVLLRGGSSVGKSSLANIINHAVCQMMGFPEGEEYTVTLNGSDKFQSEYKSSHICVIFDDVGNTRPEKAEGNPLFILIQFINNMHCSALSAEVEKKGKNDIRCRLVIVTTNTSDLHSSYFSVNPSSIMRRFSMVVDVEVKPECMDENGGIHPRFAGISHPDVWNLKIFTVKILRNQDHNLMDRYFLVPQTTTGIVGLMEYLEHAAPEHFETQDRVVEASAALHKKPHCEKHPRFCLPCPACVENFGGLLDYDDCLSCSSTPRELEVQGGKTCPAHPLFEMPCNVCKDEFADKLVDDLRMDFARINAEHDGTDFQVSELSWRDRIKELTSINTESLKELWRQTKEKVKSTDPWLVALGAISAIGLTGLALHQILTPPKLDTEGAIITRIENAARKPENFVERDNKYQRVYSNPLHCPQASVGTTLQQLERKIDTNLQIVTVSAYDEEKRVDYGPTGWANAFPVQNGYWLMVGHEFGDASMYHVSFSNNPNVGTKRFEELLYEVDEWPDEAVGCFKRIPGCDAIVARCPRGGDTTHFSKYMIDKWEDFELSKGMPLLVYHAHISMLKDDVEYKPPSAYVLGTKFDGMERQRLMSGSKFYGDYDCIMYKGGNHKGMCGSMVFLAGADPILIGMHVAGDPGSETCGAIPLCKEMFADLPKMPMKIAETTEFRKSMYDKPIEIQSAVHYKSPIHYIEDKDHNMDVYGQHNIPTSKFKSDIIESPLMPLMKEKMNYEPTHTAPKKKSVRPSRRRHMLETTRNLPPVNPKYIAVAIRDFKRKLKKLVKKKDFKQFVHPLSFDDATSGVPGVKGFDPVNVTSSMGWLLNCPKWKCLVENALAKELGIQTTKFVSKAMVDGRWVYTYEVIFDPEKADVRGETEDNLEWYMEGKRVNAVFRSNLKDEAVTFKKVAADKIRVFAGAPVSLVLICRMLTLPLIQMMTYFPEEFESAVGVDATGRDWDEIRKILVKHGKHRCGDGDFKNYDMLLRPEFTTSAAEILKWMMFECDFGDDLLDVFDSMMTDILYPVYESDGLLYKAYGSGPSGHPLTVVINGLVNCLYMRYAYYAMHQVTELDVIPLFHEVIALITYGDDNAFNVSEKETKFNMITVGEELAKIGLYYTDASKKISEIPFKDIDLIAFLKRTFNFHPVLKEYVGALEKTSIYKSLAMTRKRQKGQRETIAEICAGNLNGALRELYFHSPEEFYAHLPIFMEMANEAVDDAGHRVRDYFRPITEDEIVEGFKKTFSAYPAAKAKMGLEVQSGEVPDWWEDNHLIGPDIPEWWDVQPAQDRPGLEIGTSMGFQTYDYRRMRTTTLALVGLDYLQLVRNMDRIPNGNTWTPDVWEKFHYFRGICVPFQGNLPHSDSQSAEAYSTYVEILIHCYGGQCVDKVPSLPVVEEDPTRFDYETVMYLTVNNVHDVHMRRELIAHFAGQYWGLYDDVRLMRSFKDDILTMALGVQHRRFIRKKTAEIISYVIRKAGSPRLYPIEEEPVFELSERLLLGGHTWMNVFPDDIQSHIVEFFHGEIVHINSFACHKNLDLSEFSEDLLVWNLGGLFNVNTDFYEDEDGNTDASEMELLAVPQTYPIVFNSLDLGEAMGLLGPQD